VRPEESTAEKRSGIGEEGVKLRTGRRDVSAENMSTATCNSWIVALK
jgi:hypothetical protein